MVSTELWLPSFVLLVGLFLAVVESFARGVRIVESANGLDNAFRRLARLPTKKKILVFHKAEFRFVKSTSQFAPRERLRQEQLFSPTAVATGGPVVASDPYMW
jgi:hypothetical protein